jgi:hypothetical protein
MNANDSLQGVCAREVRQGSFWQGRGGAGLLALLPRGTGR